MRFDFSFNSPDRSRRRPPAAVRRILLLGDLRGNGAAPDVSPHDRPILKVDFDTLDATLTRLAPVVQLGDAAGGERIEVRRLDDFHPDTLVQQLTTFQRLRNLRSRLENPRTFADAAAELQRDAVAPATTISTPDVPSPGRDADTFDRLLGRTGPSSGADRSSSAPWPRAAASALDALINRAIADHIVPATDPRLSQLRGAVDAAMTDVMRAVLHDPAFQAVEAAWRTLQWLVSTLELGESLELYVLSATSDELTLAASRDGELWRRLVDGDWRAGGPKALSTLVALSRFDATEADVSRLEQLGSLAGALEAPLLAEASPTLLGVSSLAAHADPRDWTAPPPADAERWRTFTSQDAARHVGLALPRFLLRLPYGQRTDPIAAFDFTEQPPRPAHDTLLWGNPAAAYAVALVRAIDPEGDATTAGSLDGLPGFVFDAGDGPTLLPPTEVALTERAVEAIQSRGLLPLIGYRDRVDARMLDPYPVTAGAGAGGREGPG